jgi:hypothetical protein
MFEQKMMPGQEPYTEAESDTLHDLVSDAAKAVETVDLDELERTATANERKDFTIGDRILFAHKHGLSSIEEVRAVRDNIVITELVALLSDMGSIQPIFDRRQMKVKKSLITKMTATVFTDGRVWVVKGVTRRYH